MEANGSFGRFVHYEFLCTREYPGLKKKHLGHLLEAIGFR